MAEIGVAVVGGGWAGLAAALALVALGIPTLASAAQKETERVERTVPMQSGGTLTLKNFSGRVEITGEPPQSPLEFDLSSI